MDFVKDGRVDVGWISTLSDIRKAESYKNSWLDVLDSEKWMIDSEE